MASTYTTRRLLESSTASTSGPTPIINQTTVPFMVGGNTPAEAITRLFADEPTLETHPDGLPLGLGGLRVGERGGSGAAPVYRIEAVYGPPGFSLSGGGPPADRTAPNFRAVTVETVPLVLEAPVFVAVPVYSADDAAGTPTRTIVGAEWKREARKVSVNATRLVIEVNFPEAAWGPAQIAIVNGQYNKVHTFWGMKWQFMGARSSFGTRKAGQHTVVYTWIGETGLPISYFTKYNMRQATAGNGGYPLPGLLPFERWVVRWARDVGTSPFLPPLPSVPLDDYIRPDIFAEAYLAEEPTGYQSLPGAPIQ